MKAVGRVLKHGASINDKQCMQKQKKEGTRRTKGHKTDVEFHFIYLCEISVVKGSLYSSTCAEFEFSKKD